MVPHPKRERSYQLISNKERPQLLSNPQKVKFPWPLSYPQFTSSKLMFLSSHTHTYKLFFLLSILFFSLAKFYISFLNLVLLFSTFYPKLLFLCAKEGKKCPQDQEKGNQIKQRQRRRKRKRKVLWTEILRIYNSISYIDDVDNLFGVHI